MPAPIVRFSVVRFIGEDAPALLAMSESIGWPHELADWHSALAASRIYGHRLNDGTALSSSAVYVFSPEFAALAFVIVREEHRGKGLARAAVCECLEQVPGAVVILVATEFGEPLYLKLGFRTVGQIVRLIAPEGPVAIRQTPCEAMTEADLPAAFALDQAAYGGDRSAVLRGRWRQVDRGAILRDGNGRASGFAWMSRQRGNLAIGPVIAEAPQDAMRLIGTLAEGTSGRLKLEVPDKQTEFIGELQGAGFAIDSSRALMVKNAESLPGRRGLIYALASLGYG